LTRNAVKSVVYKLFVLQHITSYSVPIVSQLRAPFVLCPVNYLTNDRFFYTHLFMMGSSIVRCTYSVVDAFYLLYNIQLGLFN